MRLNRLRKKQNPQQVRITVKAMEPKQQAKAFLDDEDCRELSLFMDATAKVLRDLCKERNLDYWATAATVFELMAEGPEVWGCLDD